MLVLSVLRVLRTAPAADRQGLCLSFFDLVAVSVCGFAILDNHLHVLCRLDPGIARAVLLPE